MLNKHHAKPLKKYRSKKDFQRYSRPTPGDRVQLDVCKIKHKCYQFTAVDDCTRMRVLRLYSSKHAENTVLFLYEVLENLPFPIQRIQTDWGTEFFNNLFQEELSIHFIKYRPIKPRSPHLNGKVERSQKTDKAEFYSQINLEDPSLNISGLLTEWEHYYNYKRPHASLRGKTPYEQYLAVEEKVPMQGEVTGAYWDSNEIILPRNYDYYKLVKNLKEKNID